YEAISYCWGNPTSTWPIYLNGKVLSIRVDLAQALPRYRFQSGNRFIWADAICVDQTNLAERSYRVSMMNNIYHKSQ
ncbi:heterokaryon incompatibility, partial [Rhexocercosporidium sp. MPI-PUGE-AT-0058]